MTFREYRRANVTTKPDPIALEVHLQGKGFIIGPGGLGADLAIVDGVPQLLVRVDLDANIPDDVIVSALDAFTPTDDPIRTAQGHLVRRLAELQAKAVKKKLTDEEQDLMAVFTVLQATR